MTEPAFIYPHHADLAGSLRRLITLLMLWNASPSSEYPLDGVLNRLISEHHAKIAFVTDRCSSFGGASPSALPNILLAVEAIADESKGLWTRELVNMELSMSINSDRILPFDLNNQHNLIQATKKGFTEGVNDAVSFSCEMRANFLNENPGIEGLCKLSSLEKAIKTLCGMAPPNASIDSQEIFLISLEKFIHSSHVSQSPHMAWQAFRNELIDYVESAKK